VVAPAEIEGGRAARRAPPSLHLESKEADQETKQRTTDKDHRIHLPILRHSSSEFSVVYRKSSSA
jgi:hypothetical protein